MRRQHLSLYLFYVSSETTRKAVCSQVARLLREERLKQKLSMTVLAARAALSQQSVSYVEREMRIPNLDTLLRITAVLGVELHEIIKQARRASTSSKTK